MDKIVIQGGRRLQGEIVIGGAKNAALPLMAASLLTEETLSLSNIPHLADITTMAELLKQHGVKLHLNGAEGCEGQEGRVLDMTAEVISSTLAPYDLVRKMRASVLVLGPILARMGHAQVSLPGGCAIGTRPVDLHLKALEAMGAEIELEGGYIKAKAPRGLAGAEIRFAQVSVGATENILMAAALAKGETRIVNAAREPEIVDLADCLRAMGAEIEGDGGEVIHVQGKGRLAGCRHPVVADRIEAGSYAMAAAATDGDLNLLGARLDHLGSVSEALAKTGVLMEPTNQGVRVRRANGRLVGADVMTQAYPGFPTDLQAQMLALMTTAEGASMITETIFENRFMHVPELMRMGADITVHGASALIRGQEGLKGAQVMATDLRASVSLVIAALMAEGETVLSRVYHLDRGYERLEDKLAACGAAIERQQG